MLADTTTLHLLIREDPKLFVGLTVLGLILAVIVGWPLWIFIEATTRAMRTARTASRDAAGPSARP